VFELGINVYLNAGLLYEENTTVHAQDEKGSFYALHLTINTVIYFACFYLCICSCNFEYIDHVASIYYVLNIFILSKCQLLVNI
jgi:hypothetical protein